MKQFRLKSIQNSISLAFSGWGISWKGIVNNQQGEWWLIAQLAIIAAHLFPSWPSLFLENYPTIFKIFGISTFALGVLLSTRALIGLGPNLSPLPDPKPEASLITSGPYHNCRHPLYQALIISSAGLTIWLASMLHLLLFVCLCCTLRGKAMREERKLTVKHPDYETYLKHTPAIIPNFPFLDWHY